MRKNIAILGSTGSIGCNALDVIEWLGAPYRAVALTGHRQTEKLLAQVRRHRPAAVAVTDPLIDDVHLDEIRKLGVHVYRGPAAMVELVQREDVDIVLAAVVGAAGLPAVLAAVRADKKLALANKESLVVAGSLLIPEARKRNINILPVDSEHSAIFQAIHCGQKKEISRLIVTASGGPFRTSTREQMKHTLADALNHPTWRMGNKITIDSATMFNKALEIIEAVWLFDLPPERVEVVIHPESIVHSMVEFIDHSVIAQLGPPDMRTPIQYALTYPKRAAGISRRMDLSKVFALRFEPPDMERFPALKLAYDVAKKGGTAGAVLNAANEQAVAAFIDGQITFGEISRLVGLTIETHRLTAAPTLEDLLAADHWARNEVRSMVASKPLNHGQQTRAT